MTVSITWDQVRDDKQAAREALIPAEWRLPQLPADTRLNVLDIPRESGLLTDTELEITETHARELIRRMVAKELTSEAVTTAFSKRAAIAHQVTNCLTEIFFEKGIARAKEIDAEYARTGVPAGELHGLPISLKDNINIEGYDSTMGFICEANKPSSARDEADVVTTLRAAGAVFYCKTNVPPGMMSIETDNNVWGYTPSPYNREYIGGGSSGGEGVLIAMGGSPLGIGTDIGGSVRIPCAINNLFGLKAAGGRFTSMGLKSGLPGQESIKSASGPMAKDLDALELWCKAALAGKPWERDPAVFPVPWREVELPEKLAFGIILDDGLVKPTPAVTRALLETKAALEAAGHTVHEWTAPDIHEAMAFAPALFQGDGGNAVNKSIRGSDIPEPWPKVLATFDKILPFGKGDPPTVSGLWELQARRAVYLRKLLASWNASKETTGTGRRFDGILSPVMAFPTAPRYEFAHILYTALWNMADQTSVTFPAGFARSTDVKTGDEVLTAGDEKKAWDDYDPVRLDGCPIGLQIVVPRHQEEIALKLAGVATAAREKYLAK